MDDQQNIIIYRTADGRASVALYAKDGKIWLNQQQMAELFATSKQTISYHIINILKERELSQKSVVKEYLTTAADGKNYNVVFYSLEMIIAVGYRVRGLRGTQFRQCKQTTALLLHSSFPDGITARPQRDYGSSGTALRLVLNGITAHP